MGLGHRFEIRRKSWIGQGCITDISPLAIETEEKEGRKV